MSFSFARVSAPLNDWLRSNGINPTEVGVVIKTATLEAQARANAAIRREYDALMRTPDVRLGVVKEIKAHDIRFEFQYAPAPSVQPKITAEMN